MQNSIETIRPLPMIKRSAPNLLIKKQFMCEDNILSIFLEKDNALKSLADVETSYDSFESEDESNIVIISNRTNSSYYDQNIKNILLNFNKIN